MLEEFGGAFVWGKSVKHSPQKCGLIHVLEDEDVIQIMKAKKKNPPAKTKTKTVKEEAESKSKK